MDDLGLIRKSPVAGDQLASPCHSTAKSRKLAQTMAPQIEAVYAEIESALGKAFTDDTHRALDAMIERLGVGTVTPTDARFCGAVEYRHVHLLLSILDLS